MSSIILFIHVRIAHSLNAFFAALFGIIIMISFSSVAWLPY